jgi:hypothetical protein
MSAVSGAPCTQSGERSRKSLVDQKRLAFKSQRLNCNSHDEGVELGAFE